MNCIIPGPNLKVFSKALHCLARIGDDLFVEAYKEKFKLVTLNLRKTVCVQYKFLDVYFSSYEVDEDLFSDKTNSVSCKIQLKTLLPLFKGINLDKKLDYIKIEYDGSDFIIFKMKYKVDEIVMTHKLRLMETETLTIDISPDSGCNNITTTSTFCNQLLNMFSTHDDEILFEITKNKTVVRNYYQGAPVNPKCVRSQVNLNGSEFTIFRIDKETTIHFSLKPFRTAIQFAEAFNLNIALNFQTGGKPLSIVMKNPTFEVFYIVATLNPYSDNQSTANTSSIPAKITQANNHANITAIDQEVLMNEDWNDFSLEVNCELPITRKTNDFTPKKASFNEIVEQAKTKQTGRLSSDNRNTKIVVDKVIPMDIEENYVPTNNAKRSDRSPTDFEDDIPKSPESPRTKRVKLVFGRCFQSTFSESCLGAVLALDTDSDSN